MKQLLRILVDLLMAALAFFAYGILQNLYFFPKHFHLPLPALSFAIITMILLTLIFLMYYWQLHFHNDWHFNERPHWDFHRLLTAIFGIFLITVLGAVMLHVVSQTGRTISTNQAELDHIARQSGGLFKIMVVLIAPFCEEVIFRGMFFNIFFTQATRFNKWAGIATSGLLFAYLHDPHFNKFILVYWVLGCVLAWVYLTTRDLRYSMVTHMAYNLLGFL